MQSHHILEDRSHRITLEQMFRDDTILLLSRRHKSMDHFIGQMSRDDTLRLQHHCSPFWGRSFRTTPSLSRKYSNFTQDRGFVKHQQLVHRYSHTVDLCIPSISYLECRNIVFLFALTYRGTLGSLSSLYNSGYHIESWWYLTLGWINLTSVSESIWIHN